MIDTMRTTEGLKEYLRQITDFHRELGPGIRRSQFKWSCYEELILEQGQEFTARARPKFVRKMADKQCYRNALELLIEHAHRGWRYVEGWAYGAIIPCEHAWLVDEEGNVIDPTWDEPESAAYVGIPFSRTFLLDTIKRTGYYGILCNDWMDDAQILRQSLPEGALA